LVGRLRRHGGYGKGGGLKLIGKMRWRIARRCGWRKSAYYNKR
jgi:hypothetical protein